MRFMGSSSPVRWLYRTLFSVVDGDGISSSPSIISIRKRMACQQRLNNEAAMAKSNNNADLITFMLLAALGRTLKYTG